MSALVLLTAPDCHLCEHGKVVLDELAGEGRLTWREVDAESEEGLRLAATAPPLRPVLYQSDESVIAYGRLSRRRLRRQFDRGPVTA